ncbi:MAG: hypothetical protein QOG43_1479 [Actinomycetota bacterium]|jgi:hypothetical protein|nr:hypothetical protein [Actinomycetota bacterium]
MADATSSSPGPELSSITTALGDITRRVTAIAERSQGSDLDWLASTLFDVERALIDATRRLSSATTALRKRD